MSRTSLGSCELSHRVIARDGTWIFIEAMLAEEETMSGADAFFSSQLGVVFWSQDDDISPLLIGREQ